MGSRSRPVSARVSPAPDNPDFHPAQVGIGQPTRRRALEFASTTRSSVDLLCLRLPWSYTIDSQRGVVLTAGTGVLTEEELLQGLRALYADPGFKPELRGLFDYRSVEKLAISSETMATLARNRKYSAQSRTAFLVNRLLGFGLGRVYQTCVNDGQVMIAYQRETAVAWLNEGVPPEQVIT